MRFDLQVTGVCVNPDCSIFSLSCDRLGSHSTSDDQTGYQDMEEVAHWKETNNPVSRFRGYLERRGLWTQVSDSELKRVLYIFLPLGVGR